MVTVTANISFISLHWNKLKNIIKAESCKEFKIGIIFKLQKSLFDKQLIWWTIKTTSNWRDKQMKKKGTEEKED